MAGIFFDAEPGRLICIVYIGIIKIYSFYLLLLFSPELGTESPMGVILLLHLADVLRILGLAVDCS